MDEIREQNAETIPELDKAALTYLAIAIDKMLNYNSLQERWMPTREVVANTFDRHDFSFKWSYSEMAPTITGLGYDWTIEQTGKALEELIELSGSRPRRSASVHIASSRTEPSRSRSAPAMPSTSRTPASIASSSTRRTTTTSRTPSCPTSSTSGSSGRRACSSRTSSPRT